MKTVIRLKMRIVGIKGSKNWGFIIMNQRNTIIATSQKKYSSKATAFKDMLWLSDAFSSGKVNIEA